LWTNADLDSEGSIDREGPPPTGDAAAEGVVVFPGRPWYAAEPPAPHLRLTYAAAPPDLMDEAVRRLARCFQGTP